MSQRYTMTLSELMGNIEDGDRRGWDAEFDWLRTNHATKLRELFTSVLQHGIREPLLIGNDGRLWDGHHRVYVAHALGYTHVTVRYTRTGEPNE